MYDGAGVNGGFFSAVHTCIIVVTSMYKVARSFSHSRFNWVRNGLFTLGETTVMLKMLLYASITQTELRLL